MLQKAILPFITISLIVLCVVFFYAYNLNEEASIELGKQSARQYGNLQNEQSKYMREMEEKISELRNNPCTVTECLSHTTDEEIYGTATIQGYHTRSKHTAWGEEKICDEFVVVGGSSKMKSYFKDLVEKGNTVNRVNEEGYPVININLSDLDPSQQNIIIRSTTTRPVSIVALIEKTPGSGAQVCHSFIDLLKAEKITATSK